MRIFFISFPLIFIIIIVLQLPCPILAQPSDRISFMISTGTDFPIQWKLAGLLEGKKGLGVEASVGLLTPPYSNIILSITKALSSETKMINAIEDAFQLGIITQWGITYRLPKVPIYFGIAYSLVILKGGSSPLELLEAIYGTYSPQALLFQFLRIISPGLNELSLRSNLHNIRFLLFGYRFPIRTHWIVCTEISLLKTFHSQNTFKSGSEWLNHLENIQNLYDDLDAMLNDYYTTYVWAPSINLTLGYRF